MSGKSCWRLISAGGQPPARQPLEIVCGGHSLELLEQHHANRARADLQLEARVERELTERLGVLEQVEVLELDPPDWPRRRQLVRLVCGLEPAETVAGLDELQRRAGRPGHRLALVLRGLEDGRAD